VGSSLFPNVQWNAMSTTSDLDALTDTLGRRAKAAARTLALAPTALKDRWLHRAVETLLARRDAILEANGTDVTDATAGGLSHAALDRLRLTPDRLHAMADGLRAVAALPDPVGQVIEAQVRTDGMEVRKVRVPLGVLFFIYESRPNVTADAAALAVKSGNAIILRGGKEAVRTNTAIHAALRDAIEIVGLPPDAVQLVTNPDRQLVTRLLKANQYIDLTIPRGGEGLLRAVAAEATMPVLKHFQGNCHLFIDRAADPDLAEKLVVNAKCQRPGTCNALESLLVHRDVAATVLPRLAAALQAKGVELRGCPRTCELVAGAKLATEADYAAEFLDLILSVKVVNDLDAAIDHIDRYGSRHTDGIVTADEAAAERFVREVDSAAVVVNASTRLHDGYEFGLGAEIGISTDKFHARGPCGLVELTAYKYVVLGRGQVRS
jgi:glutamate-5-semialdehyde dehydrogenase